LAAGRIPNDLHRGSRMVKEVTQSLDLRKLDNRKEPDTERILTLSGDATDCRKAASY